MNRAADVRVLTARAIELYVQAGNPAECWGLEDYPVRAHFLIAASQAIRETPGQTSPASLQ